MPPYKRLSHCCGAAHTFYCVVKNDVRAWQQQVAVVFQPVQPWAVLPGVCQTLTFDGSCQQGSCAHSAPAADSKSHPKRRGTEHVLLPLPRGQAVSLY